MTIRWALAGEGEQVSPDGNDLEQVRSAILERTAQAIDREIAETGLGAFQFGWREEPSLNADADRQEDGRCQLRINTGTVARVYATFLALLEIPEFLQEVPIGPRYPDITELAQRICRCHLLGLEDPEIVAIEPAGDVRFGLVVSAETPRVNLGLALSNLALDFILWHELTHVVRGHLDLLPPGRRRLLQVWPSGPAPPERQLLQALEHDADTCAALATTWTLIEQGCGFAWNPLPEIIDSHDTAMKLLCLSFMFLFLVFEAASPSRGLVHARAEVRLWNALQAAATVFARTVPDGARRWTEAQQRALAEFRIVSETLGLPSLDPAASFAGVRAEIEALDTRVRALAPDLKPLRVIEIVGRETNSAPPVPGGRPAAASDAGGGD